MTKPQDVRSKYGASLAKCVKPGIDNKGGLASTGVKKMVKGGCWDIPAVYVGCYGFYVNVQHLFAGVDDLCVGDIGTNFSKTVTA